MNPSVFCAFCALYNTIQLCACAPDRRDRLVHPIPLAGQWIGRPSAALPFDAEAASHGLVQHRRTRRRRPLPRLRPGPDSPEHRPVAITKPPLTRRRPLVEWFEFGLLQVEADAAHQGITASGTSRLQPSEPPEQHQRDHSAEQPRAPCHMRGASTRRCRGVGNAAARHADRCPGMTMAEGDVRAALADRSRHAALAEVQPDARRQADAAAEAEGHRQPAGRGPVAALAPRRHCSRRMIPTISRFETRNSRERSSNVPPARCRW